MHVSKFHPIDVSLMVGAVLFGLGWGLARFCPDPGRVSLVTVLPKAALFVGCMLAGMVIYEITQRRASSQHSNWL
jgi:uncharacterized membrane protein YedE/YeeE